MQLNQDHAVCQLCHDTRETIIRNLSKGVFECEESHLEVRPFSLECALTVPNRPFQSCFKPLIESEA